MGTKIESIWSNGVDVTEEVIGEFEKEFYPSEIKHRGSPREIVLNNAEYYYREWQRRNQLRRRIEYIHESGRLASNSEMKRDIEGTKWVFVMIVIIISVFFILSFL